MARRIPRARIAEPALFCMMAVTAVIDAAASIIRHVNFGTGFDLALFDQAVWRYSHFAAPYSSIKGESLLADHFHPLVAVLAPLYWIWSDPRMLLVAQALLVAASIYPVFWFALPRLGRAPAYLLAAAYAVFWGLQVGVLFEFHEVAFAPLLVAWAILLADRRRWGPFWLAIVLLLLVKEDMSFLVVAFGIYCLTLRELRRGAALIALGCAWYALVTEVFIPGLAHGAGYGFWTYTQLGKTPIGAIWELISHPWKLFEIGLSPGQKARTIAALFGPFLLLSLGSRLLILTLPLLAERFLSTNANLWTTHDHYSLAIAPILAMGAGAGLANAVKALPMRRRASVTLAAAGLILAVNVAVTEALTPDSGLAALSRPSFYRTPRWAPAARGALALLPRNASVETVATILPHVSGRSVVALINPRSVGVGQYLLANIRQIDCCDLLGNSDYRQLGAVIDQQLPGLVPIYYRDGWLLARRPPPGERASSGVLSPMTLPQARVSLRDVTRWGVAYASMLARFGACAPLWVRRDPAAIRCFRASEEPLGKSEARLRATLGALLPTLRGGCVELDRIASRASVSLTADLRSAVRAASSWSRAAVSAAVQRFEFDRGTLDLEGAVHRFFILCTPR